MAKWEELLFELEGLTEERRGAGKRHSIGLVVLVSIMGVISGSCGYRAIGHFVKANRPELIQRLNVTKERLPSYSTIRRVLMHLQFSELSAILTSWHQVLAQDQAFYKWLHLDGKAIKGTLENYKERNQDFINVVSLFYTPAKAVIAAGSFHNKQESEIEVAREVIRKVPVKHAVFTADALHAQKNDSPDPNPAAALPG
jgi:hypothetical protein